MIKLRIGISLLVFLFLGQLWASGNYGAHSTPPTKEEIKKTLNPELVHTAFLNHLKNISKENLSLLPVQHRGRIKPFDTLARESILYLMGSSSKWGHKASQIYLGLMTFEQVEYLEFIELRDKDLRVKFGYEKKKRFFSLAQFKLARLEEFAGPALEQQDKNKHMLSDEQKALIEAVQQSWLARGIISGSQLFDGIVFKKDGKSINKDSSASFSTLQNYLRSLTPDQPQQVAEKWAQQAITSVGSQTNDPELQSQIDKLGLEVFYNKSHLFMVVAVLYLLTAIFIFLPLTNRYLNPALTYTLLAIPIVIHTIGFGIRIYITEFPPVTNMYGTMLWVSYGISTLSIWFYYLYKNLNLLSIFLLGASSLLLICEFFPLILSPDMDPIVAVLRSSFWLTIHVLTITLSYAAFSLSLLLGNIAMVKYLMQPNIPTTDQFYKDYGHYAYRSIQLGVFLIIAGIILGGIWADYSWGRFWGWDPKETWALIAALGYLLILHARFTGWLKAFGLLAMSTLAYILVIIAWYGVNFILAAGLHSYGFSSGGAKIVFTYIGLQLALMVVVGVVYYLRNQKNTSTPVT